MKYLFFLLLNIVLISCTKEKINEELEGHKFIVAGHVYGSSNTPQNLGIYTPFKQHFDRFNKDEDLKMVFLTGDVVSVSDSIHWNAFEQDFNTLEKDKYLAPGNHDRGLFYKALFGKCFNSLVYENNLYISLSSTNWNIGNYELFLLNKTFSNHPDCNNVFIFLHELIWWSPTNEFSGVNINYAPHYPGSSNYYTEVHELLKSLNKPVFLFAGDLGCNAQASPYMKAQKDNVHFIASGMGGNVADNIIEVTVGNNGLILIKSLDINNNLEPISDFDNYVLPQ